MLWSVTTILSAENDAKLVLRKQMANSSEGLSATISVEWSTSMDTQVFIISCVKIYCVLSAAHFDGDKVVFIIIF